MPDNVALMFPTPFDFFLEERLDWLHEVILYFTFLISGIVDGNYCVVVIKRLWVHLLYNLQNRFKWFWLYFTLFDIPNIVHLL